MSSSLDRTVIEIPFVRESQDEDSDYDSDEDSVEDRIRKVINRINFGDRESEVDAFTWPEAYIRDYLHEGSDYDGMARDIARHSVEIQGDGTVRFPIENVMDIADENTLPLILEELGYPNFKGSIDDMISLIWWEFIFGELGYDEVLARELSPLTAEEIHSYLPEDHYLRKLSKAALLFTLVSGSLIDINPLNTARYQEILQIEPRVVMKLARYLYNYFPGTNPYSDLSKEKLKEHIWHYDPKYPKLIFSPFIENRHTWRSPYHHVSLFIPSPLESYIIKYNDRMEDLAQSLGMVIPDQVDLDDREQYIWNNIVNYEYILLRDQQPPSGSSREEIKDYLKYYTDIELLESFPEIKNWSSRLNLLDQAVDIVTRM
jgi:hypothetical protein